ncbi:Hypothetical_protein [Hexamita inflata]|uniref:Hypothetical_protein n=1 Tax=Hexamita inflata TaxID=28002 RepID=A0AA86NIA3_9EUKA|nr:Hypothetical protein HINF_LOCUS7223 [Hexamita inflata]
MKTLRFFHYVNMTNNTRIAIFEFQATTIQIPTILVQSEISMNSFPVSKEKAMKKIQQTYKKLIARVKIQIQVNSFHQMEMLIILKSQEAKNSFQKEFVKLEFTIKLHNKPMKQEWQRRRHLIIMFLRHYNCIGEMKFKTKLIINNDRQVNLFLKNQQQSTGSRFCGKLTLYYTIIQCWFILVFITYRSIIIDNTNFENRIAQIVPLFLRIQRICVN